MLIAMLGAVALASLPVIAADLPSEQAYALIADLFSEDATTRDRAKRRLIEARDLTMAPALVEVIFFSRQGRADANEILEALFGRSVDTGDKTRGYKGWFAFVGSREDIVPKPGYLEFKASQYSRIDPSFGDFLDSRLPRTIRPEEIIFGGVPKDGIPALRNPDHVSAGEAAYLGDDEVVFGVSVGNDHRAYPRRILASHEMANDVIGGQAISLSYCTLCGSAIAYRGTVGEGETYTFGTSGLLYRSNKLMYDHQTNTLWSQILGEPVFGKLVGKSLKLEMEPITVATWGEWRTMHPDTRVLSIDTGFRRDYSGRVYADYFASEDLMFPVWKRNDDLDPKDWVWTLEINGVRKAYPLDLLREERIVHDEVGGVHIVVVSSSSGSVRVYESGGKRFETADEPFSLMLGTKLFRMTEQALVSTDGSTTLRRIPGHMAYWFGWYAFHPDTEVYRSEHP